MDGSLPGTIRRGTLDFCRGLETFLSNSASSFFSPHPDRVHFTRHLSIFPPFFLFRCFLSLSPLSPCSLDLRSRLPSSAVSTRKFNTGPSWRGTGCVRSPRIRESETEKIRFRRRAFEPPLGRRRSRQVDRSIVSLSPPLDSIQVSLAETRVFPSVFLVYLAVVRPFSPFSFRSNFYALASFSYRLIIKCS